MAKKKRKTTGKSSLTLSLTSQARERLSEMSQKAGFSRSAFVENMMAGKVSLAAIEPEKNLAFTVEDASAEKPKMNIALLEKTAEAPALTDDNSSTEELGILQAKIVEQAQEIESLKQQKESQIESSAPVLKAPPSRTTKTTNKSKKETVNSTEKDKEIAKLTQELEAEKKNVEALKVELSQKISALEEQVKVKDAALTTGKSEAMALQNQVAGLNTALETKTNELVAEKETIATLQTQTKDLNGTLKTKEQELAQLQQDFEQREAAIKANQEKNETLAKQLKAQDVRVSALAKEVTEQKAQTKELEQDGITIQNS